MPESELGELNLQQLHMKEHNARAEQLWQTSWIRQPQAPRRR